ncbi:MAG: 6-phosphofructokinase, partial [Clostridiales bacterium]|nr:6-phosphofructokinase [Clostridiales bacterium]
VSRDSQVYDKGMVTIIECMGRHAGWLTAAAALAGIKGDGPDLVYLPERDFDMDKFVADVKRVYDEKKNCIVAVSEGVHYADGTFVSEAKTSGTDGFGHAQLGGLAARLADVVKAATGAKVRPIELSLLQRCAAHCASGTDIAESFMSGKVAVESAVSGITDKMVGFKCTRGADGYKCEPELFELSIVANTEKKVPLEWINEEGNGVTQGFIDYCLPLIQGETGMVKEDGLPRFVRLRKVIAK